MGINYKNYWNCPISRSRIGIRERIKIQTGHGLIGRKDCGRFEGGHEIYVLQKKSSQQNLVKIYDVTQKKEL